jgi:hypothetical protein
MDNERCTIGRKMRTYPGVHPGSAKHPTSATFGGFDRPLFFAAPLSKLSHMASTEHPKELASRMREKAREAAGAGHQ